MQLNDESFGPKDTFSRSNVHIKYLHLICFTYISILKTVEGVNRTARVPF